MINVRTFLFLIAVTKEDIEGYEEEEDDEEQFDDQIDAEEILKGQELESKTKNNIRCCSVIRFYQGAQEEDRPRER